MRGGRGNKNAVGAFDFARSPLISLSQVEIGDTSCDSLVDVQRTRRRWNGTSPEEFSNSPVGRSEWARDASACGLLGTILMDRDGCVGDFGSAAAIKVAWTVTIFHTSFFLFLNYDAKLHILHQLHDSKRNFESNNIECNNYIFYTNYSTAKGALK